MLAINKALLKKPCLTAGKLKKDLRLVATTRTISKAINLIDGEKFKQSIVKLSDPLIDLTRE